MNQQTTDTILSPQEKIDPIYNALAAAYGQLTWTSSTDPLSELILTILSQHTSDTNRDRAFRIDARAIPHLGRSPRCSC